MDALLAQAFTDMYALMILVVVSPAASPPWFYRTENNASAKPSALLLLP